MCKGCKELHISRGSQNPRVSIENWAKIISRAIESIDKGVLTDSDFDDAAKLVRFADILLGPKGIRLKEEATAQVAYGKHMSNFAGKLQGTKYQKIGDDSVPGMQVLFEQAADLCKTNPRFKAP